jgi:hypothetical protein
MHAIQITIICLCVSYIAEIKKIRQLDRGSIVTITMSACISISILDCLRLLPFPGVFTLNINEDNQIEYFFVIITIYIVFKLHLFKLMP